MGLHRKNEVTPARALVAYLKDEEASQGSSRIELECIED